MINHLYAKERSWFFKMVFAGAMTLICGCSSGSNQIVGRILQINIVDQVAVVSINDGVEIGNGDTLGVDPKFAVLKVRKVQLESEIGRAAACVITPEGHKALWRHLPWQPKVGDDVYRATSIPNISVDD